MSGAASILNSALVEEVTARVQRSGMRLSPEVATAFSEVPRHLFVPGVPLDEAYADKAIILKDERGEPRSSSSQPTIMAVMLEQLEVREGQRVLEIGTGSGYNAALVARLVGRSGRVVTIDLEADLVDAARRHLTAAGFEYVQAIVGDGALGCSPEAPFDRIVLTAAAWDVAPAWFEQLADDGRVVLPLMLRGGQVSVALVRSGDHLESVSVHDCGFMPIRGPFGHPGTPLRLGPRDGLFMAFPPADQPPVSAQAAYAWLSGPWSEMSSGVRVAPTDVWKVAQWLALRDPASCFLWALGADAEHHLLPRIPAPGTADNSSHASGLVSEQELAVLAVRDDSGGNDTDGPVELVARSYGEVARLAGRMVGHIQEWDERERPTALPRRIRVYSRHSASSRTHDGGIERKSSVIMVDWD